MQILLYQTPASTALLPLLAPVLHPGVVTTSRVLWPVRGTLRAASGTYLTTALSSAAGGRVRWSVSYLVTVFRLLPGAVYFWTLVLRFYVAFQLLAPAACQSAP